MSTKFNKKLSASGVSDAIKGLPRPSQHSQSWDDLEQLYQTSAKSMMGVMATVDSLISLPGIIKYVKDTDTYNIAIRTLTSDFEILAKELTGIHEEHQSYTGRVSNDQELSKCIHIFGKYTIFYERFQGLTLPTVMSITDMAIEAKEAMERDTSHQTTEEQNV